METKEKIFVHDLYQYINQKIVTFLMVSQKELREGKKDYFVRIQFIDKTGPIVGNIWNNATTMVDLFNESDVCKVEATVISYKDQIQLNVSKIRKAEDDEYELVDYIPKTNKDTNLMAEQLFAMIDSVKDTYLSQLLKSIFDDKELFAKFAMCPAAKTWHHNYVGGLLEHTLSVTKICEFCTTQYDLNRDILITGALLHDFGKVYEYQIMPSIDFTDIGRLIGHIPMADNLICEKAKTINNFPENTLMKLRHLILSHHGEMEKGAVKVPQTIEAVVLHFADNMDAQTIG
ncbi:MAG: HD domain-containing protein, partial [Candidatus Cloacimonetes bacterium]|nr:HD domain-containing protein [Candidatus Cloacimonadota bacterium]